MTNLTPKSFHDTHRFSEKNTIAGGGPGSSKLKPPPHEFEMTSMYNSVFTGDSSVRPKFPSKKQYVIPEDFKTNTEYKYNENIRKNDNYYFGEKNDKGKFAIGSLIQINDKYYYVNSNATKIIPLTVNSNQIISPEKYPLEHGNNRRNSTDSNISGITTSSDFEIEGGKKYNKRTKKHRSAKHKTFKIKIK